MDSRIISVENQARRRLLQRSFALAAAAAVAAPAIAKPIHDHKMRLRIEGDAPLDWVLSLYTPPILATGLPPGTAGKARYQFPSSGASRGRAYSHGIMAVSVFLAPAGVPPGVPAPELAPVSTLDVDVEEVIVADAVFGDASTRPYKNVAILGRIVANDVDSPFGSLVNRALTVSFGFDWITPGDDRATFKLVAGNAAGSHITVVPEAGGEIAFE